MILEIRDKLNRYWEKCTELLPYDGTIGAATYHPSCFFRSFNSECNIKYIQRCTREADGREGKSPGRLLTHTQYQVILKPAPENIIDQYLESLYAIGLSKDADIKFIENNWESQSLGAFGVGWEVLYNGLEITQFTFFNKMGDIELDKPIVELAYGVERCALMMHNTFSVFNLPWRNTTYGDLFLNYEEQFSQYYKNEYIPDSFDEIYALCIKLIEKGLYLPAYSNCIRLNNIFNQKDARKELTQVSRNNYIAQIRSIANKCANLYIEKAKIL